MAIIQGLGGPNLPPEVVRGDGQMVNIPSLQNFFNEARSLVNKASYWILVGSLRQQELSGTWFLTREPCRASFPEKLQRVKNFESVPQTDTGRQALVC